MKQFAYSNLAGLGVLLLTFGMAPGAWPGQTPSQTTSGPAPAMAPSASGQQCRDSNLSTEQFDDVTRNIEQDLQGKLAKLQERVAKEDLMSSPELEKLRGLSAELEGKQSEIESRAGELAARAQELAESVQDKASQLIEQEPNVLIQSTDDSSGWLGIEIAEVAPEKAKDLKLSAVRGVIVMDVEPDGPAARAGLKENDVITRYDGQIVEGTVQFRRLVRETPPGRSVTLEVSRSGSTQSVTVELGDRSAFFHKQMEGKMRDFGHAYAFATPNFDFKFKGPDVFDIMAGRTPLLGITAEDISGQLGAYFGAPDNAGILIREVRSGTPAEKAGLKAGDVIVKVDGKPVRTLAELRGQLREKTGEKPVNLSVLRKGSEMSVPVTIEKPRPIEPMHMIHRAQL